MKKLVASPPLSATPSPQSSVMLVFVEGLMPELRVNFSSGSPVRLTATAPESCSALFPERMIFLMVASPVSWSRRAPDTLMLYSESWQPQHVKVLASEQDNHYI